MSIMIHHEYPFVDSDDLLDFVSVGISVYW